MANRFLLAHALPDGTITPNQKKFLTSQSPATLAAARQELTIFGAVPKLSKRQAWLLINRISQAQRGGAA